MRNVFTTLFFCLFAAISVYSQSWRLKIDTSLLAEATSEPTTEFLVVLEEQADLHEAAFLITKEEKGAYVAQTLRETALRTQGRLLQILQTHQSPHRPFFIINAIWAEGDIELIEQLASLPEVAEIHANPEVRFDEPVVMDKSDGNKRAPEWGLQNINADDVWTIGYKGAGVVVAGQDTGYDWDVAPLKDKYRGWNSGTNTADHNYDWHDAIHNSTGNPCGNNSPEPCDDHNHGTHTMGTMVGLDGANEIGVAPEAKWIGCRNMDEGVGTPATYLECFEWFLEPTDLNDQNPNPALAPHVINNSWGCPASEGCNSSNWSDMETAINNLLTAGVFVVASAGNSGSNCSSVDWPPAMFAGSFAVGATNSSNTIANFSSRGPVTVDNSNRRKPDISAPGVGVRSVIRNGDYATWNGTSMAGPHVAGTVALILSAKPSLKGNIGQIQSILENSAVSKTTTEGCGGDGPNTVPNNTYGYGIVDALAAVNLALGLLPVELIGFSGRPVQEGVLLNWETALPGTLNHFEVEHADERLQWQTAGKIPFSPEHPHYGLLHENPVVGLNYYRLKMVDIDGTVTYSHVIAVNLAGDADLVLFPVPAKDQLSMKANWQPGEVTIHVFDVSGRLLTRVSNRAEAEEDLIQLDISGLPSGMYFLKITAEQAGQLLYQSRFVKH